MVSLSLVPFISSQEHALITRSLSLLAAGILATLLAGPVLAQGEKVSSAVELAR